MHPHGDGIRIHTLFCLSCSIGPLGLDACVRARIASFEKAEGGGTEGALVFVHSFCLEEELKRVREPFGCPICPITECDPNPLPACVHTCTSGLYYDMYTSTHHEHARTQRARRHQLCANVNVCQSWNVEECPRTGKYGT